MAPQWSASFDSSAKLEPLILVEEITHRVLNEYAEAISTLRLAAASAPDARSVATLSSVAVRLLAHAEAHRALQAPASEGPVDLGDHLARLCACLTRAQLAENGVRLMVNAEEVWLDAGRCWRVGLIVAELVRNAVKHGLSHGPGVICIEIAEASGWISCAVRDDGRAAAVADAGRGRRLVQALAAEIGGSVDWTFTPAGCCVRLAFERRYDHDRSIAPMAFGSRPSQPAFAQAIIDVDGL
jgi:two-component sensor histidine kinase